MLETRCVNKFFKVVVEYDNGDILEGNEEHHLGFLTSYIEDVIKESCDFGGKSIKQITIKPCN